MTEIEESVIYSYVDKSGKQMHTPNLEFARIMAYKYETYKVYTH
jgi:hypothetical protein